ncbi:MAG: polysaccharide deacetylase family protein [Gammaproteobacteria bacterium]|nr:polysaccharide deacetylase family protein [Gammaproteobacteria bacterium]
MAVSNSLKQSVQWASHVSGLTSVLAKNQGVSRIFMYHGVDDHGELVIEAFKRHLRYLSENFRVISMTELVGRLESGSVEGDEVVLTFDDGLRNNVTNVYPILHDMNIPATYYVCPQLVTDGVWIWNLDVRERLKFIENTSGPKLIDELIERTGGKSCSKDRHESIVEWLKTLKPDQRNELHDLIIRESRNYQPTEYSRTNNDLANWDELRKMDSNIITIGSHTSTHPILTTLTEEQLETEIGGSRKLLEEKLQRPVDFFSYPNGSNSDAVVDVVKRHYKSAVLAEYGYVKSDFDLFRLKRLPTVDNIYRFSWGMVKSR